MKKNLFRKFLALFLTGTLLAGVGCKDYDDDIDDLKGQINDLKGQVELKADASALQVVTDKLNGIDFSSFVTNSGLQTELDKRLADYAKKSDLKDWLTSDEVLKLIQAQGYQTKDEVQKLIDEATKGQLTAADVEKIFETMIASEETMGKLQAGIQEIIKQALIKGEYVTEEQMRLFVEGKGYITGTDQLSATQIDQILTAVANSVSSETATVTDAIKKVLGDNFATYMANYLDDETVKAEMGKAITDTILKELTDANVTLKAAIESMIQDGINDELYDSEGKAIYLKEADLKERFENYDAQIKNLWSAVENLAGRIQSLVYVPKSIDGIANFGGIVVTAGSETIRLTTGAKSEMTFLVSPKTLATQLAAKHNASKDVFSFVPEKVTRAEAPKFEIEGDVVGSADGKITMFVSTDYTSPAAAPSDAAETYAIALKVTSKSSVAKDEDTSVDTGIEYTTAYIPTVGDDYNAIANIVLAKEEGEGDAKKLVEIPASGAEYEMVYNQTEPLTMLSEYSFAYKMGNTIISLDKAAEQGNWDVELDAKPVYTRSSWTVASGMTKVVFDPADPMKDAAAKSQLVKITIQEGVPANVDKTIVDEVTTAIHAVGETENVATNGAAAYTAKTTLTRFQLPAIENLNASATWNYSIYSTNGAYLIQNIVFDAAGANKLTKAQYDQFKASVQADNTWIVTYGDEAGTLNQGIQIQSVNLPTINTNGDAKFFDYWIGGYKGGSGTLDIEKTVTLGQAEEITLKGKITLTGLPSDLKYTLNMPEAKISNYGAQVLTVIAQENFAEKAVYELLPEDQTFFADASEFLAFMRQSTNPGEMKNNEQKNATTQALEAAVRYNGIGKTGTSYDRLCVDFQRSYVDFDNAESYTFTAPEGACYTIADAVFSIAIEGSVTINKDQGFYLAKGTSVNAEGNVVVMGTADKTGNSFTVETITLTNAYNAAYPDGTDASKIGLKFSLAATTPTVTPVPTITNGTNVTSDAWTMDWNGCGLNSVEVVAEMTYEGLPIASKTFEVILTNPIDIASWGTNFNELATPIAVKTAATVNVYEKVLAAKNYGNPKHMLPRDIFGNELVDASGVTTFATGAYGFEVKFGDASYSSVVSGTEDFSRFKFDPATGEMTVAASDDLLGGKVTAQIQVTFTYKYSLDATKQYAEKEYPMNITLTFENKK